VDEALSGGAVGVAHSEDEPRSERNDEYQRDDDDNDDEADQTVTVTTTSAVAAARRRGTLRLQLDPLHTSTHTHDSANETNKNWLPWQRSSWIEKLISGRSSTVIGLRTNPENLTKSGPVDFEIIDVTGKGKNKYISKKINK